MTKIYKSDIETRFRNKYRIPSARLQNYDYSQSGAYFVTICTKNREHYFGEIMNGKMKLSDIGKMAKKYWKQIPDHFSFVILGEWVVMPNHIHGIIMINKNNVDINYSVETQDFASLQSPKYDQYKNKFGPQSKNLASIIRGFKIGVTKYIRQNTNIYGVWQSRFHDRIIRNKKEYNRISEYILYNPQNWKKDDYFK